MEILSYYDWLWIAARNFMGEELPYPRKIRLRMVITKIAPEHRNDFEYLEPAFEDAFDGCIARTFHTTWDQYCEYLENMRAKVDCHIEWIFEGSREGSLLRRQGGDAIVDAAWWFMRTGEDPIGIFDSGDLSVIEETFAEPVKAETREQVIEWLEKIIDESNKGNERR